MTGNFEIVIFLLCILVVLSAFADKIKLPYPILLVIIGLVIGFTPFLPILRLNPDVVFLIFLPPLIFEAAFRTSWLDFKRELRTISALAFPLVFFTTVTVAVAAHYFIAGFTWPLSFLLGAIVSPPDAVAAAGIIKGKGLNKKVITIIEGESLLNDASALVAYRYALVAVFTGSFVFWQASLQFLLAIAGGAAAGFAVSYGLMKIYKKVKTSPEADTSLSLLTPYLSYGLAEAIHASGILAVVTAGIYISWHSRATFSFQTRLFADSVWKTLIFLLNGIIFILIGLQLPDIIHSRPNGAVVNLVGDGIMISVATIAIRIAGIFVYTKQQQLFRRNDKVLQRQEEWKNAIIIAWTGTRGVVSLATALALPFMLENGRAFPKRDDILFVSFIVIMITLVAQGLSLPWLIRLLKIRPVAGLQEQEENDLALMLTKSSISYIKNGFPDTINAAAAKRIRKLYEFNYRILLKSHDNPLQKTQLESDFNVVNNFLQAHFEVIRFQRLLIIQFQNNGIYSEEALIKAEHRLDIEELWLNSIIQRTEAAEEIVNKDLTSRDA